MKKFIKILILCIIITAMCLVAFLYRENIKMLANNARVEIEQLFANDGKEKIYTEEEIKEKILKDVDNTGGEYTGKLNKYFYSQLDTYSKILYKSLEDNIEKLKAGNQEIEVSNSLSNVMQTESGREQINTIYQNAWNAFRLDHTEIFYIDIKNIYLETKTITYGKNIKYEFKLISNNSNVLEDVNSYISKIENKKKEIIKSLEDKNNTYKVLYIHNWLIDHLNYDITMHAENNNNIYGAIIENNAICEGYAKAFKYLLDELNIPSIIVCGEGIDEQGSTEKHAWNEVYLNGKWYAIDVTWDDPIIIGKGNITKELKYKYFLRGASTINKNHFQSGKMTENPEEIEFKYPVLSEESYK